MPMMLFSARFRSFFGYLNIILILCWSPSCDWEVRILDLEQSLREEKEKTHVLQGLIQEIFAKIECNNEEVSNFIKKCTSEEVCDDGKIVSSLRSMKTMDHVMVRVPYHDNEPLQINIDNRRAQLIKLFRYHRIIEWSTKLLVVAIPSPDKITKGKKGLPVPSKPQSAIDYTVLNTLARKLRSSLYEPDYNLPRTVKMLEPQVPRCDARTERLVQLFHGDNQDDQLLPVERMIQSPYVDLIIFLLEC